MEILPYYSALKLGVLTASAFGAAWLGAVAVFAFGRFCQRKPSFDFSASLALIFSAAAWLLPHALSQPPVDIPDRWFCLEIALVFAACALYIQQRLFCSWRASLGLALGFMASQGAVLAALKFWILK